MSYKTNMSEELLEKVKQLGIYTSSTLDGYWEERAIDDLNYVYVLGQKKATDSFRASFGKRLTRVRVLAIRRKLAELKKLVQL